MSAHSTPQKSRPADQSGRSSRSTSRAAETDRVRSVCREHADSICTHAKMCVCVCWCVCICVNVCVRMCVCMCVYTCIVCKHVSTYTWWVCVFVCGCVCVFSLSLSLCLSLSRARSLSPALCFSLSLSLCP